jgi:hypothetical protein
MIIRIDMISYAKLGSRQRLLAVLAAFMLGISSSGALAQKDASPELINENATVPQILEYLNRTGFPNARIGLIVTSSEIGPYHPRTIKRNRHTESFVFSAGFGLISGPNDCHIVLRNEGVLVYDASKKKNLKAINLSEMSESQPPYAAEFSVWLETASDDGGKRPYLQTRNPERAELLGAWGTEFESRGFFTRSIFGIRIPALKDGILAGNQFKTDDKVAFIFNDKQSAEQFDTAFRHLIKQCQRRISKPRWN